jgi:branched-subunit amino acid ABC-type transport system permease component
MKKTKLGKAMRAVSNNKDVAEIVGISSETIYSWSFVIGSLIAGVAGVLIGLEQNLEPTIQGRRRQPTNFHSVQYHTTT